MAKAFKQYTINIDIIIKNSLVETHHSIGMVEYYHRFLQQVYFIIITEVPDIKADLAL